MNKKDIRFIPAPNKPYEEIFLNFAPLGRLYTEAVKGQYRAKFHIGDTIHEINASSIPLLKVKIRRLLTQG